MNLCFHKQAKFSFHLVSTPFPYQTERRFKSGKTKAATGEKEISETHGGDVVL